MAASIQTWFETNRVIVFFVYGQVFFVAGWAIIVQSRRHSRLQLAQSLPWLAAFCLIHSLNEWGDLFIPIQGQYTPTLSITILRVTQIIILGSSFACLLRFGIGLLRPITPAWAWVRWVPMLVFLVWLFGPFWFGLISAMPLDTWLNVTNALSRYSMGLTGAAIGAFGLFRYSAQTPALANLPNMRRHLNLAALALGLYAVFGGLIVPPAPFFPANLVNTSSFSQVVILPVLVFRSLAGLLLAISMFRAVEIFELETDQLISQMEIGQVVASERERIGRDLHDGSLQRVYAAGLLVQAMRKHAHGQTAKELDQLIQTLNSAIGELRGFLSVMRPADTNADLKNALQSVIDDTSRASEIDILFLPSKDLLLPPEKVTHLAAVVREALSNVLRHANATRVEIIYTIRDDNLHLTIRDNGVGLPRIIDAGYGLRNMSERARFLGGELKFGAAPDGGTCINLEIPLGGKTWK